MDWTNRRGSRTLAVVNRTSHMSPATPESKPEMSVNVRTLLECSDHPATPVENAQMSISPARSVVDTRPRSRSGTKRISNVS